LSSFPSKRGSFMKPPFTALHKNLECWSSCLRYEREREREREIVNNKFYASAQGGSDRNEILYPFRLKGVGVCRWKS
jgi:hypothetical protein